MISYAFCYCKVNKWSFLDSTLGLNDLRKLRFGKISYEQILNEIEPFECSRMVYINDDFPSTFQKLLTDISNWFLENNCYLDNNDSVAIVNMQYFPRNKDIFENKLIQAQVASLPLIISQTESENEICSIVLKAKNIKEINLPFDSPVFQAPDNTFVDLNKPSNVMDLFNAGLVLRNFNSMSLGRAGYFVKHSKQKEKMKAEHEFLSNLPTAVRPFYPCCGDYIDMDSSDEAGYEIELVPTLDAAKFLINNYFSSKEKCEEFLCSINRYFDAVPHKKTDISTYKTKMTDLFIKKGENRRDALKNIKGIERLNQIASLYGFESVEQFANLYLDLLKKDIANQNAPELYYSHGDLFFGNMLYDPSKKILKLIDPKGGKNESCYVPIWYDLAKLSHSFLGNYDLMVYGLITPYLNKELSLSLNIQSEFIKNCQLLSDEFKIFLSQRKIDIKRVRLYEGSLFLSMMPLHSESPLRMACQLIKAIEIYKYLTEGKSCQ